MNIKFKFGRGSMRIPLTKYGLTHHWYLLIGFGLIEILQWIIIDKNVSKL